MSLITAEDLQLSFGDFDLFRGISVSIANDSKIGLIGPNGVGKTSLLLILAGINQPTSGRVTVARNRRIGYLRQEAMDTFANRENTVFGEMLTVFEDLQAHQQRLNSLEEEMAKENGTSELLEMYGELQQAFESAGGYDFELRIQQTLQGLGLGKNTWEMPLSHLSGGQKTRALLARLLLEKPALLMLDEPTNHLDIEAVQWLERTLREWSGAVLIVSHDRYFLDNTVNTIWEMGSTGIDTYHGNYSAYLLQRDERWELTDRVYKEEKARLLKEVDYIQRNWVRASTHAQALGRLRRLTRDLAVVDTYGVMALRSGKSWREMELSADHPLDVVEAIRKVNAISQTSNRPPKINPKLTPTHQSGTIILRANHVSIGYPGHILFTTHEVELRRCECAALIGPNGSGKTTFLKTLLGQLDPVQGEVQLGASLRIGYFSQVQDSLDPRRSVLEELNHHKEMNQGPARSHLAQYLFRGDDVFKPINALSGGERARLALAILALEGANFLVLDEPTNHLDIPAQEALQEVLEQFDGTILLVSHDRYLIDRLATQIWELRDRKLNIFHGQYHEFILRQATSAAPEARKILLAPKPLARDNSKQTRKRILAMEQLEERIRHQEVIVQKLYNQLQKDGKSQNFAHVDSLSRETAIAEATLERLISNWEELAR